ncbi:RNA polymerase sigma factor [Amycolatopsis sp. WGS_07]|uniref:RNA polymerase sigma factor n=1 Tax=Amycolatopsis sp. WGS_07 TaxID=3076764 RepID=UPI003872DADB
MPRHISEHNAEEIADLFTAVARDLHRYASRLVQGDRTASDDLVQEAFHAAASDWDDLRGREPGQQRAWLFVVARNKVVSRWKAAARVEVGVEHLEHRARASAPEDTWDKAVCDLTLQCCRKVLDRMLSTRYEVAHLHWYEQWSTREIADLLGIAASTVRVHLKYSRDELAAALGPDLLLTEEPVMPAGKEEAS